jgi:hypothetical protein
MLSIRREINAKETAVAKFGTTESDGKPYVPVSLRNLPKATSSNLIKDDNKTKEQIEEARQATSAFISAMSGVYEGIAKLEVEKQKERFREKFSEVLNKMTTYQRIHNPRQP